MSERRVAIGGVCTRVVDEGEGPAVVLIHATPFDLDCWRELAARLSRRRRVIRYDLRGHGSAAAAPLGTPDDLVSDVVEILDLLGVESAHVVGHSLGGVVALRCALDHPDRVNRLSLLDSRCSTSPQFATLARAMRADPAAREAAVLRWFPPEAIAAQGTVVQYAQRIVLHMDPGTWADGLQHIADFDVFDDLPTLAMPVDLLVGEYDHGVPAPHVAAMAAAIPRSRFEVVRAAGPLMPMEHTDLMLRALLRVPDDA